MAKRRARRQARPASALDRLKDKQRVFTIEYLKDFNAARAARDAGYSERCDRQIGSRLLTNVDIANAVAEQLHERGVSADRIKVALAEILFGANLKDFAPWLTGDKTLEQLEADGVNVQLIESASIGQAGVRRIVLYNRMRAAKELARVLGLVTEKRDVSGKLRLELGDILADLDGADPGPRDVEDGDDG